MITIKIHIMPRLCILTKTEQKKFDASPLLTNQQKQKNFAVNELKYLGSFRYQRFF